MYHYFNTVGHPHTIDSTKKYGLADTQASGTYTSKDGTHKNPQKLGHKIFLVRMRRQTTIKHKVYTIIATVTS